MLGNAKVIIILKKLIVIVLNCNQELPLSFVCYSLVHDYIKSVHLMMHFYDIHFSECDKGLHAEI